MLCRQGVQVIKEVKMQTPEGTDHQSLPPGAETRLISFTRLLFLSSCLSRIMHPIIENDTRSRPQLHVRIDLLVSSETCNYGQSRLTATFSRTASWPSQVPSCVLAVSSRKRSLSFTGSHSCWLACETKITVTNVFSNMLRKPPEV